MKEEIDRILSEIDIGTKRNRRILLKGIVKWGVVFFSFLTLVVIMSASANSERSLAGLVSIFIGISIIPGFLFIAYTSLYIRPYSPEEIAFKSIVNAVEMLSKSNQPMAYDEAYQCLEKAYQTVRKIRLSELGWYSKTNEPFKRFLENLELVVIPATAKASIRTQHLEEIALAVYSQDPSKIDAINKILENEPSYKKEEKPPKKRGISLKAFIESGIGRPLVSLCLGYGLVLIICLFYALATLQDFLVFARERPDIIIVGGLIASGITFWRTKSES
jgi:hypothetical protein